MKRTADLRSWGTLAMIAVALVTAWLLYPRPEEAAADENVTEVVFWVRPGDYIDVVKPAIEEFEKRNPEYRVLVATATVNNATGDPTRFLLGVAGDVPPDLILFDRFAIVEWASRGAFSDLTPYIQGDKDNPGGIHEENFFESAWRESIFEGRNYAIATDLDTRALYYAQDPLIRAGFVYTDSDPEVVSGLASAGQARPPRTWEELCRKRAHLEAQVDQDGRVTASGFVRRMGVNENVPESASPDLGKAGIRSGDIAVLVNGTQIFRARVAEVLSPTELRFDFSRELAAGTRSVPSGFRGKCELKLFDQDSYTARLTRFDPQSGQMAEAGFIPYYGNSWLYMYGWLNGGEFMNAGGTQVTLDDPHIVGALQWVTDVYDSMGGYESARAFQVGATSSGLDPFVNGKVAMLIDTDAMMQLILTYRPDMRIGAAPSPVPDKRRAEGARAVGWGGGWAMAIPATAKNKDASYTLMRWLASFEANQIINESAASLQRAQGLTYMPRLHADRRVLAWLDEEYVEGNPGLNPDLKSAYGQFADLLPVSRYRPVTPVGQQLWSEHVRASEAAVNHTKTPYEALNYGKRRAQYSLEKILAPPTGAVVNWELVFTVYISLLLTVAAGFFFRYRGLRKRAHLGLGYWHEGVICAGPWLLGFVIFSGGPILFSLVISFCHYDVLSPARFAGFENYTNLVGTHYDPVVEERVWNDPLFWKSLWNTVYMTFSVPLSIVLGLGIAMLLDSGVRGLKFYRTIFYLPAIVPAVAGFILWFWIFDPTRGMMNQLLRSLSVHDPPGWLLDPVWSKPSLIIMVLWGVGASMIIWLAGLKDIPESLYEAASVDGATRLQRFLSITLPMLSPYILFNTIMGMIAMFQYFEAAYIMTDGGPADTTLFFAYKLFNEAFRYLNMGVASAMAWVLFLVVFLITLLQLWAGKRLVHYGD